MSKFGQDRSRKSEVFYIIKMRLSFLLVGAGSHEKKNVASMLIIF